MAVRQQVVEGVEIDRIGLDFLAGEVCPQVFAGPSLRERRFMYMLAVIGDGLARFGLVFSTYHDVSPYTVIGELGTYSAANKHFYMWDSARMNGNFRPHNRVVWFLKI